MKIPISLIIDDPTPVLNNFYLMAKSGTTSYEHARLRLETKDGRPLIKKFPRSLLSEFCDTVERRGIKGKFIHNEKPVFDEHGGHAMLFKDFENKLRMSFHWPERNMDERTRILTVKETETSLEVID